MNILSQDRIERVQHEGYQLHISDCISRAANLIQKELGMFIAFTLVSFAISMTASFIPFASFLVSPPLTAGWIIAAYKVDQGERLEFGDFFKGFNYLGELLLANIFLILIVFVIAIPFIILFLLFGVGLGESGFFLIFVLSFVGMIGGILLMCLYTFNQHFIIFAGKRAWDAMETSRNTVMLQLGSFLGFIIILTLINIGGMLCLFVGLLYTIPLTAVAIYIAFADIFRLDHEQEGDDIINHLVE